MNKRSTDNLKGVHPDLVKVVNEAAKNADFIVIEGLRTLAQQKKYVAKGFSKTLKSRHLDGHAVDLGALLNGKLTWDFKHYITLSNIVKEAAKTVGVPIEWGGDWKTFKDGPHFQLPRKQYP